MLRHAVTLSVLLSAIVVPILEVNETHVFNPDWTPHVRIHEVWQLLTNTSIGVLYLWLTWVKKEVRLAAILCLLVMGGFLGAFALKDLYGGSMKFLDGSEKTLLGINIGVFGFGMAFLLVFVALLIDLKKGSDG